MDGDGDMDLACATWENNSLMFVISPTGFQTFGTPRELIDDTFGHHYSVHAADLDVDGDPDLVSDSSSSYLTLFFQGAEGTFSSTRLTPESSSSLSHLNAVSSGDFDGDGDQDLLTTRSDHLAILCQTRPGQFDPAPLVLGTSPTIQFPEFAIGEDLDGDGDQDVVAANSGLNNLLIFWGGR
jgi:hypothetical protein